MHVIQLALGAYKCDINAAKLRSSEISRVTDDDQPVVHCGTRLRPGPLRSLTVFQ